MEADRSPLTSPSNAISIASSSPCHSEYMILGVRKCVIGDVMMGRVQRNSDKEKGEGRENEKNSDEEQGEGGMRWA